MAQQALFRNKLIWFLLVYLYGCQAPVVQHDILQKFYPDGSLQERREYTNGKKTGEYIAWWENGNRKLQYFFEDDEYEGCCREWNRQGALVREMHYHKGYEDGSQKVFYDNGKVRSNYIIKNGRRYGMLGTKNCVNPADSIPAKP